jgi:glutathione synthase/RimK-type ligase-like ATP-grasp enzyme
MRKIGVLYGMENTFPPALVDRINKKNVPELSAEHVRIGCTIMAEPSEYRVLVDRISHDIEFYRTYLKNAAVTGTTVLNDPFRATSHDRFYACSLATKVGVCTPRTVILPQKEHPWGTTVQSMRNLQFPLDWETVFQYIGFPAQLKPVKPSRWKGVLRVTSRDEFFSVYDKTGSAAMMLQESIESDEHYRSWVVGEKVRIIGYCHEKSPGNRYSPEPEPTGGKMARMVRDAGVLSQGLGFDLAMIEFAVRNGTPYAIELTHTAPEADVHSIGPDHFEWLVENVAELAIRKALGEPEAKLIEREMVARA